MAMTMENTHALVVGIANYQNISPLPSTVLKDAQDIYNLLVEPKYCGYSVNNVQLLLDDSATYAAINQALDNLSKQTNPDSTVLIYFSGHGGQLKDGSHIGEYLFPVDTIGETRASVAQTAISGAQFTQALQAIPARKIVILLDCCHAGGIGQPKDSTTPTLKTGFSESYYDALRQGRGRAILASSRSSESSYVSPGSTNSLFTKHLLEGLQGGIFSNDGLIRIFDLFEYLQPKVTAEEPRQHPIFKADLEENFPIALYLSGQKEAIPKVEKKFRYDVYISYAETESDDTWVWETLIPLLEKADLRVVVSEEVQQAGVDRVVSIPRGINQAKRILIVLSNAYLTDNWLRFEEVIADTIGIEEGSYRLFPVQIETIQNGELPMHIKRMVIKDLTNPRHTQRRLKGIIRELQEPLPLM